MKGIWIRLTYCLVCRNSAVLRDNFPNNQSCHRDSNQRALEYKYVTNTPQRNGHSQAMPNMKLPLNFEQILRYWSRRTSSFILHSTRVSLCELVWKTADPNLSLYSQLADSSGIPLYVYPLPAFSIYQRIANNKYIHKYLLCKRFLVYFRKYSFECTFRESNEKY